MVFDYMKIRPLKITEKIPATIAEEGKKE